MQRENLGPCARCWRGARVASRIAEVARRALLPALIAACSRRAPSRELAEPLRTRGQTGFLKGQLHAHSGASADSATAPEEVARYYAEKGYDFLVLTDHNTITTPPAPEGLLILAGVEITQNLRTCDPPPPRGLSCLLHVNALFVTAPTFAGLGRPVTLGRLDLYGRAVDAAVGLGGLAQLDHPNFHYGADADIVTALAGRGLTLVEIANEASDSANEGDAAHPSTEAMWDAALTRGARVFATASDDAHHYADAASVRARGEPAYTGDRGFVMVRAAKDAASIRGAVASGDFYASTGVVLSRLEIGESGVAIDVAGERATFDVIGEGGVVIASSEGAALRFDPKATASRYLRIRIVAAGGRRAFTQPLFR